MSGVGVAGPVFTLAGGACGFLGLTVDFSGFGPVHSQRPVSDQPHTRAPEFSSGVSSPSSDVEGVLDFCADPPGEEQAANENTKVTANRNFSNSFIT